MLKLILLFCTFTQISGLTFRTYSDLQKLIIGGESTKIEMIPYQTSLHYFGYFYCAGIIVNPTHVVTAAHCVMYLSPNTTHLSVRVGAYKINTGQSVRIKNFTIHPKFERKELDYDVAVLRLKTPLKFSKYIRPIKLAKKDPKAGQHVRVSGWGFLKEFGPVSKTLQSVLLKVVDRKECREKYKKIAKITSRMICAWEFEKDSCFGDSGGPLVYNDTLVGIVSAGQGCAKDFPGIYTRISDSQIRNFIIKIANLSAF